MESRFKRSHSGRPTLEDLRPSASDYIVACRKKLLKFLPSKGEFILDAASGPIQYPEYLEFLRTLKRDFVLIFRIKPLEQAKQKNWRSW